MRAVDARARSPRARDHRLAAGWDEVRLSTSATDPTEERLAHFWANLGAVKRLQRRFVRMRALRRAHVPALKTGAISALFRISYG